jgi:putative endonuclease
MGTAAQMGKRPSDELGRRGENLAAEYLTGTGLVVLSRNWRCRDGEVDLVATDGHRTRSTCAKSSVTSTGTWRNGRPETSARPDGATR